MSEELTPAQCRAGRAILKWSVEDLAKEAGVGKNTVTRFENDNPAQATTTGHLKRALESAGVCFTEKGCVCPPALEEE